MRRAVLAVIPAFFTLSCAKMFSIGHEDFACSASLQGGVCAGVDYVYENRDEIFKGSRSGKEEVSRFEVNSEYDLVLVGKGKRVKLPMEECEKSCDPVEGCSEEDLRPCREGVLVPEVYRIKKEPDREVKEVPVPVKEEDWVQRIWIEPYVDAKGNLVEGHFVYTVVRKGRWLLPDGKEVSSKEER